jgi:hypothetical protein
LTPIKSDYSTKEINAKSVNGVKLTIPAAIPEKYWPLLISQNKKFAFLGNADNQSGTIIDLNTKKIVFVDEPDSVLIYSYNDIISNTGRFIYSARYGDDKTILFKDFSLQKYYSIKTEILEEFYGFKFIEFSPNDITYMFYSYLDEERPTISVQESIKPNFTSIILQVRNLYKQIMYQMKAYL